MDRALNRDTLTLVLGEHEPGRLPTVEELTNLIADIEVQAFMSPGEVGSRVLRTAWYLHGVASAANAADLYTPQRQERAFAVSAHIFDLALNGPVRNNQDRLTLAFAAQVGYRRAQLDPNAVAIWRRVDALLDYPAQDTGDQTPFDEPLEPTDQVADDNNNGGDGSDGDDHDEVTHRHFETMALRAGTAFLGLHLPRVTALVTQWRTQAAAMAAATGLDRLHGTMFGPAEQVVAAVGELVEFLRLGNRGRLDIARTALTSVIDRTAGTGDHDARWVAAHLLHITDGLETSSIWTVLPPGSPDRLAQAFTIGDPPVLTLWPPQRDLLTRTQANPLDPATRRLLLSVPTSAGKTLLAQIMICHHLATEIGDVCYVTSMRSLGREMRQALASRLRVLQRSLGGDLPDFSRLDLEELLALFSTGADNAVEVMTPERLSHMLRREPDAVLNRFSMFVIDEAHMMGQPGRGLLLESLVATLATTDARLVLLSGVMGNAAQVATWLDDTRPEVLYTSDWRGPRRLHALLYTKPLWGQGTTRQRRSTRYPVAETYPLVGELQVRPAESRIHTLTATQVGEYVRHSHPDGGYEAGPSTPFYKRCARVGTALMKAGSLLMIVSQRAYARDAAKEIASHLDPTSTTDELVEFLTERLGAEHPLVDCVDRGVGYHHAGLPTDILEALEQATRDERLRALVATTTLTDGVNLPVRTVLISESKYPGQDPSQQMDAAQLLNAVGRAGRAGRETEGWIVLALNQRADSGDFDLLRPAADDLTILSTLGTESALDRLADAEQLIAESSDALFGLAEGEPADFASFVWFVLTAADTLDSLGTDTDLSEAVRRMLAFTQLPPDLADRWLRFAGQVQEVHAATAVESRRRWTVAGTSLGSARRIEQLAATLARTVINTPGPAIAGSETAATAVTPAETTEPAVTELDIYQTLTLLDDTAAFANLLALPEYKPEWVFRRTPRGRARIDVDLRDALQHWLDGDDIPALADAILPEVEDVAWRLEQTVDAVSETFEHYLSWTVGVMLEQANELLESAEHPVRFPASFAYLIRYGVNTDQALGLLIRGVRSRRLAHLVGRQADERGLAGTAMLDWLEELHIEGWRTTLHANPREIEDLAEVTRDTLTSVLRDALSFGTGRATLRHPMDPLPLAPLPVAVNVLRADKPIEVWATGYSRYKVGVVAARDHADVLALTHSGLTYTATTDGSAIEFHLTL